MSDLRRKADAIDPFLGHLVDLCRERFDAKMVWLKAGETEAGKLGVYAEPGCVWTVYVPPKVKR